VNTAGSTEESGLAQLDKDFMMIESVATDTERGEQVSSHFISSCILLALFE